MQTRNVACKGRLLAGEQVFGTELVFAQALAERAISCWPLIHFRDLLARFNQIEGYRCLSLIRASGVVKCQLALACRALRSSSQAAISSIKVCLSGMRRSRHWDDRTPSSDSARSSQLPCLGV